MSYRVVFNHPALKRNFDKIFERIPRDTQKSTWEALLKLADNPRPHGVTKITPAMEIYDSMAQYRIRIQNHRIFYDIDDEAKVVSIIALRKRDEKTYS